MKKKKKKKPIWSNGVDKNKVKVWLQIWNECGQPIFVCVADLKRKTKTEYERYMWSARYHGIDFPVSRKDWQKGINSDKLNDDTVTSICLPPLV